MRPVKLAWGTTALFFTVPIASFTTAVLVSCLADPREDEKVNVIDSCDLSKLSTDPKSIDATIRAYVEASRQLNDVVTAADAALRDACLAVYADPALGITPTGPQKTGRGASACQPLLSRIANVVKDQPNPPGVNSIPQWIEVHYGVRCASKVGAREQCLSTCADACDITKCDKDKVVGKCPGECLGTCTTIATDIDAGLPCHGNCVGTIPIPNTGGANPGGTCQGECFGTCGGAIYTGNCEGGCASQFSGRCGGTCHGRCNGTDLPEVDAGTSSLDGSAAPLDQFPPPANNSPGNCGKGLCEGTCSDHAYGTCFARCVDYAIDGGAYTTSFAGFFAGACVNSVCVGTCRSAIGSGAAISTGPILAPGICQGECTQLTKPADPLPTNTACDGTCRPTADLDGGAFCTSDVEPATAICEGALACNQNAECSNACEAKAALDAECGDPLVLQAYAVTDPDLFKALHERGLAIGKAVASLRQAQKAFSYIGNRTYGDFVTLGARGDLAAQCVAEGVKNTSAADAILSADIAADPTTVRYKR